MKILGVTRNNAFSPNMQDKDLAIMKEVQMLLNQNGHLVSLTDEDKFAEEYKLDAKNDYNLIFTMMRSAEALDALKKVQKRGVIAINPYEGISNAKRKVITLIMQQTGAPIPDTYYEIDEAALENIDYPCWIKFADGWAKDHDDIVFAEDKSLAIENLKRLRLKYPHASFMATRHLEGDLVKFYGVQGTDFFFFYYPDPEKSKFGLERINGRPQHFKFNKDKMKTICDKIAEQSLIYIYGGDCIVKPSGDFYIIDFNDWPSFSACKNQAAQAITSRIESIIK